MWWVMDQYQFYPKSRLDRFHCVIRWFLSFISCIYFFFFFWKIKAIVCLFNLRIYQIRNPAVGVKSTPKKSSATKLKGSKKKRDFAYLGPDGSVEPGDGRLLQLLLDHLGVDVSLPRHLNIPTMNRLSWIFWSRNIYSESAVDQLKILTFK